ATFRARAQALARLRPTPVPAPVRAGSLVVRSGSHLLAIPLSRVREVLAPGPLVAVPGGDHDLRGLRSTGSGVHVVADLTLLLGGPGLDDLSTCAVVLLEGSPPLGILVEDIREEQEPPGGGAPIDGAVPGRLRADGVLAVDVDALLALPRLSAASASHPIAAPTRGDQ